MTSTSAIDEGAQLASRLIGLLRDPSFLPTVYPTLFAQGVDKGSFHAYMLSALVLTGDKLGYSPVSDSPVFDRLDKLLMGEGAKRPDAVWFGRGAHDIQCLIEFERYTSRSLAYKARNLLIMGKEIHPSPQLLVLDYWTYTAVSDATLQDVLTVFAQGFRHPNGVMFPPLTCPALLLETHVEKSLGTRVVTVSPRLFVCNGEDKPYIVQKLEHGLGMVYPTVKTQTQK